MKEFCSVEVTYLPERRLIRLLCDGEFHSGIKLGRELGLSRAAIWKQVRKLEESGIRLERVRGKGYRIPGGVDLLDAEELAVACGQQVNRICVFDRIDSTNTVAMSQAMGRSSGGLLLVAESQMAGRGRRGRVWQSPYGANLYMSYVWEFSHGLAAIQGLSLVVGIAICRALESLGINSVGLKWPNDVVIGQKKCCGVLIEIGGDAGGGGVAVIGIGVNVRMPTRVGQLIDQPWTDIERETGFVVSRTQLIVRIVRELMVVLDEFDQSGFAGFIDEWRRMDTLTGSVVTLSFGADTIDGVVSGVSSKGALVLETRDGVREFAAGEVSVRRGS